MQIVCNEYALHEMSNPFFFRGGVIFDPIMVITFWANTPYDKLAIVSLSRKLYFILETICMKCEILF